MALAVPAAAIEERLTRERSVEVVRVDDIETFRLRVVVRTQVWCQRVLVHPNSGRSAREELVSTRDCGHEPNEGTLVTIRDEHRGTWATGVTDTGGAVTLDLDPQELLLEGDALVVAFDDGTTHPVGSELRNLAGAYLDGRRRAELRAPRVGEWDGSVAGLPVANATRTEVARACLAAGLAWTEERPDDDHSFRCASTTLPTPRAIGGIAGAHVIYEFADDGRVRAAALNMPFGSTRSAYFAAGRVLAETTQRLGAPHESEGSEFQGRAVWRVRDSDGRLWVFVVATRAGTAVVGYQRAAE